MNAPTKPAAAAGSPGATLALIVVLFQKHDTKAGVGTLVALMIPCVIALCLVWILLFARWLLLGLPWGL